MDRSRAIKYLYKLISYKDYLEAEIIKKLKKKEVNPIIIEELISEFKEYGYIDDNRYIETYIYFSINKLTGPYKIKNKLLFKGANIEIVEEELEKQYPREKQKENLRKLISKSSKDGDKLISFCVRKGYSLNLVIEINSELNSF